jgi:polysaccharide export outer membrane protein
VFGWYSNSNLKLKLYILMSLLMTSCAQVEDVPIDPILQAPAPREEVAKTPPEYLNYFHNTVTNNSQNYRLGNGDKVSVDVWGYPKLSGQHIIGPDGKISLPLAGDITLTGLTRQQAVQTISNRLANFYEKLSIALKIDQYTANKVFILGRIKQPGEIDFGMNTPTLLGVLAKSGGFTGKNSLPFTRCTIFRGRNQLVNVDLEPLLTGKNLSLNVNLERNDVIYIPDLEEKLVYVLGEVKRPGAYNLGTRTSFIEILSKAGGFTANSNSEQVNLIRPSEGLNQPLALKKLLDVNQNMNIALAEGDIIYVPKSTIAKIEYNLRFLSPITSLLGVYSSIDMIRVNAELRKQVGAQ